MGTATSTAAPERARWPRLAGSPHPQLRTLLPRGYAGFTEATTPRHLVLPATTTVPLVVKLLDYSLPSRRQVTASCTARSPTGATLAAGCRQDADHRVGLPPANDANYAITIDSWRGAFDAILHLNRVTPSRLLPAGQGQR